MVRQVCGLSVSQQRLEQPVIAKGVLGMAMKHQETINYTGGFERLATDLGNLRYDALGTFLELLSKKLERDAKADEGRERHQLAKHLHDSAESINKAWKICEPFMT